MSFRNKSFILSVLSVVIVLATWYAVAYLVGFMRHVDFPTPHETIALLIDKLSGSPIYEHSIYEHTLSSLSRWISAYVLAVFSGILIGVFIGLSPDTNKLFMPLVHVLQLIPGLAWIPISLLIFGMGNASTIFMIYMLALTPIIQTTSTGIRETPNDLINTARIMGADKKAVFFHVLLPASLFHIVDGMRIALANSWRVLIAAEMIVGSGVGLGFIIIQSRWSLDYISAFVSLIIIVLIGLTAEKFVFKKLENNLAKKYGFNNQSSNQLSE
jgi:ABC-type nitrate/sulfonate/bicarbonate transport system permease component